MSSRLVTLATFDTIPEAHIALNSLRSAGIRAELSDENVVGLWWTAANAVSGIKVNVLEEDVPRAMEVIGPLVGVDVPVSEEELTRQALAGKPDADDPEPDQTPDPEPNTPTQESAPEPIDREKAAWRAFVIGWFGIVLCPLAFLALYFLLQAAFGTGPPLSRLGRVRLFVATATVATALFIAFSLSPCLGTFR
jgi:hypothetical protein